MCLCSRRRPPCRVAHWSSTRLACGCGPKARTSWPARRRAASDADDAPLDAIDHGLFDDVIWPHLAARIPAFEALRVHSAWAGYYEMNAFDQNAVVGALPGWDNAFIACGFSGHGMQHAPAVGSALAERIAGGRYTGLDLSPLGAERLLRNERLIEHNVI